MCARSVTRDNHYVPIWYQKGFLCDGSEKLQYLNLTPDQVPLKSGEVKFHRALNEWYPAQCFYKTDLYSTFFSTSIDDEIERRLFGAIDDRGSIAIRAFQTDDENEWIKNFEPLFEFIDAQKLRTPKGLDWLRAQYPSLSQNELMMEMQGIRFLNCTIWSEGVREIVSAEDSSVKFIVSDHPVTIYNHGIPPEAGQAVYPNDPSIALRASQTIFPLCKDFCLVLSNLEYARDPSADTATKRTFARNYRSSMVSAVDFIRSRKLTDLEVTKINRIIKARERRYIAAGCADWLYPEIVTGERWRELRSVLLPPEDEIGRFGGEMYARYDDGHVHYQDEFGRTEKEWELLNKPQRLRDPKPSEPCGCGSAFTFRECCKSRPKSIRPSWEKMSIRERNIVFFNGIQNIIDPDECRDWIKIRRRLSDDQISKVYRLFEALWPRETDMLALLPKPDGRSRAVYTGSIHPETFSDFAASAPLNFGELIVEHPFVHNGALNPKFKPVDNPSTYHLECLRSVVFLNNIMPLVDRGLVNLVPDLCNFDLHLRDQMMRMAEERTAYFKPQPGEDQRMEDLIRRDAKRFEMMKSKEGLEASVREFSPELDDDGIAEMLLSIER